MTPIERSGSILVVGSINMDLVTYADRMPEAGETAMARDFAAMPGGKGANQAVAAARMGAQVAMLGAVGADAFGDTLLQGLREAGVDTGPCLRMLEQRHAPVVTSYDHAARAGVSAQNTPVGPEGSTATGTATIIVEPSGENRILIAPGANHLLTPTRLDRTRIARAAMIVTQLELPLETVSATLAMARDARVAVLLTPAPAPVALPDAILKGLAWICPNRGELARLTGEQDPVAGAAALHARGVAGVVVTLGAEGVILSDADGVQHIASIQVTPVDTTGAGDAFAGTFAAGLIAGMSPIDAVKRAVAYAAMTVTARGAQPSYPDAERFAAWHKT